MKATFNGSDITLEYIEPSMNEDGVTALTDLDHTRVYVDGAIVKNVLASAPTGGGHISTSFAHGVPDTIERDLSITVTAVDGVGNEGAHSIPIVVRVDRLAPGIPF